MGRGCRREENRASRCRLVMWRESRTAHIITISTRVARRNTANTSMTGKPRASGGTHTVTSSRMVNRPAVIITAVGSTANRKIARNVPPGKAKDIVIMRPEAITARDAG